MGGIPNIPVDPELTGNSLDAKLGKVDWEYIFRSLTESVMVLDEDHKIVAVNSATLEATGLPEEKLIGQTCYRIFHCSVATHEKCPHKMLQKLATPETIEMDVAALQGTCHITVAPVCSVQGHPIRTLHIAKDLTELKPIEQELILREKRSGALEMVGAACHELSQPMQVICGYCDLMLLDIPEDNTLYGRIQVIQQEVDRIASIIKKIHHVTKDITRDYIEGIKNIDIDRASDEDGARKE
jgi:PAS domain S-box-containing protein